MSRYNLIFVLDDGTELTGKKKIDEHIDLFPQGILEKARPICFDAAKKSDNWNHSNVRVYQNGKIEPEYNVPSAPPFNDYFECD